MRKQMATVALRPAGAPSPRAVVLLNAMGSNAASVGSIPYRFSLEDRNGGNGDPQAIEISVHDYFVNYHAAGLTYSGDLPCINVGKPKRLAYLPIELCQLPLQRYTKSLSTLQRSSLVEKLRQKPQERMSVLFHVRIRSSYDTDPMLKASEISIAQGFTQVAGRVLQAPKIT